MTNRKAMRRARRIRRTVLTVCLMALVAVISIGGTIAWLTSSPDAITNTFTVGDIEITLAETKGTLNATTGNREFKMVPGNTIDKDPKVSVTENSEACWLFVEITESEKLSTYISYTEATGWTKGTGTGTGEGKNGVPTNVIFRSVDENTAKKGVTYDVLSGNQVTVKKVTNAEMEAAGTTNPTLTFKAYAIQSANITTAGDAWSNLQTELNPTT